MWETKSLWETPGKLISPQFPHLFLKSFRPQFSHCNQSKETWSWWAPNPFGLSWATFNQQDPYWAKETGLSRSPPSLRFRNLSKSPNILGTILGSKVASSLGFRINLFHLIQGIVGKQNLSLQNVSLWQENDFRQNIFKKQKTQSLSFDRLLKCWIV